MKKLIPLLLVILCLTGCTFDSDAGVGRSTLPELTNYQKAENFYKEKDYKNAYKLATKVNNSDDEYKAALTLIKDITDIYEKETLKKAKDYYKNKKYNTALKVIANQTKEVRQRKKVKQLKAKINNAYINSMKRIKLISAYSEEPNSAGGVDFDIVWKNTSNKTIKYITFGVRPYNAVGDVVECEITDDSDYYGRVTGPIKSGQTYGYGYSWECAWYNNTIKKIKIFNVEIEYMDGSTKNISKPYIKYLWE